MSELPDEPVSEGAEPEVAGLGSVILKTGLMLVAALSVFALLVFMLREPLTAISGAFVEAFGGPGVFLGFFFPDAFTVPWPNDAFLMFGIQGGLPFWEVVAWGSAGSLSGGSMGYAVGRRLKHTRWVRRQMEKRGAEIHRLVERYGLVALALAAITPLPYSLGAWACGALDVPFRSFFLVSLLRIPRIMMFLWFIKTGFVVIPGA